MAECNAYGFDVVVQGCADGPVGGGDISDFRLKINANNASSEQIKHKENWDGSTHNFGSWHTVGTLFGCNILSSTMTIKVTATDEVTVEFTITVDCTGQPGSGIYQNCGGPGPHTLSGSQSVPITTGANCPF